MPVLSFPLHNSGSVPRRINGEVILRRGVLFFFFVHCLVTFLVSSFVCLSFLFPLVFLHSFHVLRNKNGDGIFDFCLSA